MKPIEHRLGAAVSLGVIVEGDAFERTIVEHQAAEAIAEIKKLRVALNEMRGALMEIRTHLHAQGRRPVECHIMSVIDDALRTSNDKGQA